jgi:Gpi18-like mannosyltransferase
MLSERFDQQVALRTIVLLASFPFSFYYGAAYAESIYLLAIVVAFYGIERQAW